MIYWIDAVMLVALMWLTWRRWAGTVTVLVIYYAIVRICYVVYTLLET